jgi:hypothetical protein
VNSTIQGWAKQENIHLSRSATYQPTSNALIENFNNILRKMIREGFVRNNNLNWVNHLSDYLYNRNHSKHGTTKYKPVELWRQGREKLTKENIAKILKFYNKKHLTQISTSNLLRAWHLLQKTPRNLLPHLSPPRRKNTVPKWLTNNTPSKKKTSLKSMSPKR